MMYRVRYRRDDSGGTITRGDEGGWTHSAILTADHQAALDVASALRSHYLYYGIVVEHRTPGRWERITQ